MNFHETPQGRKFFNKDVPDVIRALNGIVEELRQLRLVLDPKVNPVDWLIAHGITRTTQLNDCPSCGSLLECNCQRD